MPANLPPQFFALQAKLKQTKDPKEKISILEQLLAICPKHKGTEKVRKDLKRKIAKLKKEKPKKTKREAVYFIPKEGAGQVVIVGPANSGKSSLLNALTNAKAKVKDYPFTTQLPQPAMMPYENILIQLVDTPPLFEESPGWLKALLSSADALLVIFDFSVSETEKEIKKIKDILENWHLKNKKIIFLANKMDLEKAKENFEKLNKKENLFPISIQKKEGLEELKRKIFKLLEIIRVYSKPPKKEAKLNKPFIMKKGSRLIELIEKINPQYLEKFKYARLLRKDSPKIQIVGKDYLLKDEDIVEIHI